MYVCKNCGQTYSEPVKFCGKCGGDSFEAQMAYAPQPEYVNPAPTYSYVASAPAGRSKAPAIVGMIFGISSMIFSFYHMLLTFILLDEEGVDDALSFFWALSVFVLPFMIVGLIMSFKDCGSLKGMSITGRVTCFISLGMWLIGFLACLSEI